MRLYNIKDRIPYIVGLEEWNLSNGDKFVGRDFFGDVLVSTVFLGMDHGFGGTPLLFETMVFGGEFDGWCMRWSTWDEAESGHLDACRMVNRRVIERDNKLGELGI